MAIFTLNEVQKHMRNSMVKTLLKCDKNNAGVILQRVKNYNTADVRVKLKFAYKMSFK